MMHDERNSHIHAVSIRLFKLLDKPTLRATKPSKIMLYNWYRLHMPNNLSNLLMATQNDISYSLAGARYSLATG